MSFDFMTVIQSVSALIAAGTPAITYYVMIRTNTVQTEALKGHMKLQEDAFNERCTRCRSELKSHLDCVDGEVEVITGRQKVLREEILPEKFVPVSLCRREHDRCVKDREKAEDALWTRINQVNDRVNGAKSDNNKGGGP